MKAFTNQNIVGVFRQSYTSGKSAFTQTQTTTGYLRAMSLETAAANGFQFGYAFELIAEYGTSIHVGDKVVINATTYTVKGVASYGNGRGPADYLKALITLPEI